MTEVFVTARLNAKLQPMHRGDVFEDPLNERLEQAGHGTITGGGTQLAASGEVEYADLEVRLNAATDAVLDWLVAALEDLGAPHGSQLLVGDAPPRVFGTVEGMGVYLNGTDLHADVYETCDSNAVYDALESAVGERGHIYSYWQGPTETALYLYGPSFDEMRALTAAFLASYPLCARCRVVKIA
ncbi:MAG TPA: hypothetical protein VM555_01055 [Tahibacter sp.]|nr:hypothetical protein [Tahibacter sp.]